MSGKKNKSAAAAAAVPAAPTPAPKKPAGKRGIVKNGNAGTKSAAVVTDDTPAPQRSIFGDWTGKTPVSLLHEHCQKANWEKPEFDIKRRKDGYFGTVTLSQRNKKTAQMQTVIFSSPDESVLPSSIEAKHLAATYTLHRIKSDLPLYRVLPPEHRDYWKHFDKLKNANNSWMYTNDPFNAHAPMKAERKKRSVPTKEHASSAVPMPSQSQAKMDQVKEPEMTDKMRKDWENLPAVQMGADNRELVERVVKKSTIAYQPLTRKHTKEERKQIVDELVSMGFRSAHANEALDYCADKTTALDWLCLHVPEDDLPANFMLANYNPTMTTISHTTKSLSRDWLLKRMSTIGYPQSICEEAFILANEDDAKAIELLQWRLAHGDEPLPTIDPELIDAEELEQTRLDEITVLESIYESSRFQHEVDKDGRHVYSIPFSVKTVPAKKNFREKLVMQVSIPKDSYYPYSLPLFVIECDGLPSFLKLALIKGLIEEAEINMGMPFIYMCAEWLQEHVDHLIAHPPKLRDMSERLNSFDLLTKDHVIKRKSNNQRRHRNNGPLKPNEQISQKLKDELEKRLNSSGYMSMGRVRSNLPAHTFKATVVKTVLSSQVTIVSGETGCGKTTQVPQFIMDEEIMQGRGAMCNMICTQPRKISAIGVAERVASERCEKIGNTVGYAVRGETKISSDTRLQFVTTGVLLRRLQSDPTLDGISHVMIDEVHERSVDSDFLLIILREVLKKRKDLKVVLMSATINQALFSNYFNGAPAIEIPGFTHPVEDFYLEDILDMTSYVSHMPMVKNTKNSDETSASSHLPKGEWAQWQIPYLEKGYKEHTVRTLARYRNQDKIDYELIASAVKHIVDNETVKIEGGSEPAILIFMPGAMEIKRCVEALQDKLGGQADYEILPLHANLSPQEQTRVFKAVPAHVRKIVVATNVAETSITIEGVVYVIDSGRVKETRFDAANSMMHLVETWASRASCKQRRGRAGRTRPGKCFKLFTRETDENKMSPQQVPELLRTPLEQLCLTVKSMGEHDVRKFLSRAIDPPSVAALDSAIRSLRQVEAIDLTERGNLTALGKHMANIPADLRISKMLLFGSVFGCLDPILTIASIMSLKSPFTSPMEKRAEAKAAREKFNFSKSDWLTDMKAYEGWYETIKSKGMKASRNFCEENFLSFATLNEVQNLRRQYTDALSEIGFYNKSNHQHYNENSENVNLLKSILFAGLNPNVAKIKLPDTKYDKVLSGTVEREKEAREIKYYTKADGRVFLHPSSLLFNNNSYNSSFLTYFSRMTTSKTFIRDGTEVPSYGILFFGGQIDVDHMGRGLKVGEDGWIRFRSWARIGVLVNQLKRLLQLELEFKIEEPELDVSSSGVAHAIISLITNDGV